MLLRASHRGGDDVHAEPPELVLHGGESRLGGRQLGDRDHDADVLLEHVPVAGDHGAKERVVLRRVRQVQAQPGRRQHLVQERLGQRCEQIFFVGEIPVEHRGRLAGGRRDVGQGGAVKATLREQLSGGQLDGRPGLAAFRGERRL